MGRVFVPPIGCDIATIEKCTPSRPFRAFTRPRPKMRLSCLPSYLSSGSKIASVRLRTCQGLRSVYPGRLPLSGRSRFRFGARLMEWSPLSVSGSSQLPVWHFDAVSGRGDHSISRGRLLHVSSWPEMSGNEFISAVYSARCNFSDRPQAVAHL